MTSRTYRLTLPLDPERPTGWALVECLYCLVRDAGRTVSAGAWLPGALAAPPRRAPAGAPWRVLLSHTSDLRTHPPGRSFVAAAEAAVMRAGHAVADMAYFGARDTTSAEHCATMVGRSDVLVCIVGRRYGSPVRERPELSYTELEFELATSLRLPRLVFLVGDDSPSLPHPVQPPSHDARQDGFRTRLRESGLLVSEVASPADLEISLLQSLVELRGDPATVAGE